MHPRNDERAGSLHGPSGQPKWALFMRCSVRAVAGSLVVSWSQQGNMKAAPQFPTGSLCLLYRCPFHPDTALLDEAGPPIRSMALCPICDGPLELVDVVRGLWSRRGQ